MTNSIYAVLFSNGIVKVGATRKSAASRIQCAGSMMGITGISIIDSFSFDTKANPFHYEKKLIKYCQDNGKSTPSNEWFFSIDFAALKEFSSICIQEYAPDDCRGRGILKVLEALEDRCRDRYKLDETPDLISDTLDRMMFNGCAVLPLSYKELFNETPAGLSFYDEKTDFVDLVLNDMIDGLICYVNEIKEDISTFEPTNPEIYLGLGSKYYDIANLMHDWFLSVVTKNIKKSLRYICEEAKKEEYPDELSESVSSYLDGFNDQKYRAAMLAEIIRLES